MKGIEKEHKENYTGSAKNKGPTPVPKESTLRFHYTKLL
jgi:hypothetical protein